MMRMTVRILELKRKLKKVSTWRIGEIKYWKYSKGG